MPATNTATRTPPAIVFSDLDGCLLDHDSYRFDAARPALAAIRRRGVPLILTTSKTLAETIAISRALAIEQPLIVENGCALCLPRKPEYPFSLPAHEVVDGYAVVYLAPRYDQIRAFIDSERTLHGWKLRGFGDMHSDEVARLTGLPPDDAAKARQRLCSEPFVWQDDPERLDALREAAAHHGLRVVQGGRFWHLLGNTDKAIAVRRLCELFDAAGWTTAWRIAVGDSENDRRMLEQADVAVIVQRSDGSHLDAHGRQLTVRSELPGPPGWNAALLALMTLPDTGSQPA